MITNIKIKSLVKFTNLLVKKGKKAKASSYLLKTLFSLKKKTKKNPLNTIYSSIKALTPGVSTRKTVVAGRLYHLPCAISSNKALYFGCNWLQDSALNSKEGGKALNISDKLSNECLKILKKKGNSLLSLKQHNKTVSENRPFLRFIKRKRGLRLPRKVFLRRRRILYLKRRRKKIITKPEDTFEFKLNKYSRLVKKYPFDTKLENKFQGKIDRKFVKIEKKRELISKISSSKNNKNDFRKKRKFNKGKRSKFKNKTINKKN